MSVPQENRQRIERAGRLKSRIRALGGPKRFSEISELPLGSISEWMAGRDMRLSVIPRLAEVCGVTPAWLAFGDETPAPSSGALVVSDDRYVPIPRYDVQASAGLGALVNNEQVVEYIRFDKDWLSANLKQPVNKVVLIEARGDSMEPTIRDGDVLLIDISNQVISSSAIHVIAIETELLVKRIERRLNGSIIIYSDNPRYPPQEVTKENRADLRIVGQVVWQGGLPR